jgi:hypothetical protein
MSSLAKTCNSLSATIWPVTSELTMARKIALAAVTVSVFVDAIKFAPFLVQYLYSNRIPALILPVYLLAFIF